MPPKAILILFVCFTVFCVSVVAQSDVPADMPDDSVEVVSHEKEYSYASLEPAQMGEQKGIAVIFNGTDDLHYYAKSETAPAPDLDLKLSAEASGISFGDTVFPPWTIFGDPTGKDVEVYVGDFNVFIPIQKGFEAAEEPTEVTVTIAGIACTSKVCVPPFKKTLTASIDFSDSESWTQISFKPPYSFSAAESKEPDKAQQGGRQAILSYSTPVYYLFAILAGISINIMPCVLPIIPIIMMRLIEQSKKSSSNRIASGMSFCIGVVLFFTVFALISAIVNISTGAVLDLNSLFRYPSAVIVLFLAIVFFGLVMLDVVTLNLPSSVTSQQGSSSGIVGTLGMGFFAGILSTPCSGALLGFVLVWAQTQPLFVSSTAIILMGVGMALPYAAIVLVPKLLDKVPKPGRWMELFKKSTAFLLFFIAAKLTLGALPKDRLMDVLIYGIVFCFCVWIWGKWVNFSTPAGKKWTVRLLAVVIAVMFGVWLLPAQTLPSEAQIDWEEYDASVIRNATADGQPVLIKFTADWCTNCKVVDKKVYQDAEVASLIKQKSVLPIKADTTVIDYEATVDLKQVYGEAGNVPVTIVILPDGKREKLRGIFDKQKLIGILQQLPEAES